jgi:hypothetical protein
MGKTLSMDDPREKFLSQLDLNKCRVELSQSPIVLLCGGKVPFGPLANARTLRHALTLRLPDFEIFMPEEITNWSIDSRYKNLVDLEKDLASICTLVVIILESPGSIAELGVFSQIEEFKNKLTVFTSSKMDPNSFINLGILRHIKSQNDTRVRKYPWIPEKATNFGEEFVDNVIADIAKELKQLNGSQKLNIQLGSHLAVAICTLLELFIALKENELISYLAIMGRSILPINRLRGMLFLLEKFRLVREVEYSDSTFFVRGNEEFHNLRLASLTESKLDAFRVNFECKAYYKNDSDGHRRYVIKTIRQGTQQ